MTVRIVWFLAVMAMGSGAFAQNGAQPPQQKMPTVHMVEGDPITVDYGDGRVAVVKRQMVESPDLLALPFQVFDTLCSDNRGQQCRYKTAFREVFYFFAWLKNPDASKIDQPVMRIASPGNMTEERYRRFESNQQLFGADKTILPLMAAGMAMPQIECDDFSWLPEQTKEAPAQISARRWDGEMMLTNPETGASENRLFMTATNVSWKKIAPQTLELNSYGSLTTNYGQFLPVLMIGDVVTATVIDPKEQLCSAELKPGSIQEIAAKLSQIEASRPALNVNAEVVIAGQDESSKAALKNKRQIVNSVSSIVDSLKTTPGSSVE